jgi:amidase
VETKAHAPGTPAPMFPAAQLVRLTATEAVALLKTRQVTPLELIDAAIKHIEAVDPQVNALPIRFFDQARAVAKSLPGKTPKETDRRGWLAGLPIAVKDYNDVAGQVTTYGSPIFARNVAPESDLTVAVLEASGAIPIAKSNVPEFAGANTFNPVFGATRNPWDLRMTVGGSSGGSAAALAAGMVWLATGNDLGGSLRIPASYCGVVGMRPSVGRVPRPSSLLPFDPLWVEGPIGRTVADVALMLDAQSTADIHDPLSLPPPDTAFTEAVRQPRGPRRVAFSGNLGLSRVDPEVVEICRAGVQRFQGIGSGIEEACPDLSGAIETFQTLRAVLIASMRGELLDRERDRIAPEIVWNIEKGLKLTPDELLRAERQRAAIYHRVARFFERYDVLACPTVSVPPFPVEQRFPTEIDGERLTTYIDWMFLTFVVTLTSCPAISIPCGFTRSGLPVGLQLIARPRGDFDLLAAAQLLEDACRLTRQLPIMPGQSPSGP